MFVCVCVMSPSPPAPRIILGGFRGKRPCPAVEYSPNTAKKKRLSPLVPSAITHSCSGGFLHKCFVKMHLQLSVLLTDPAQEQVVPVLSPQEVASISKAEDYRRRLPEEKDGVKPLDLFNGEDIFAPSHEE